MNINSSSITTQDSGSMASINSQEKHACEKFDTCLTGSVMLSEIGGVVTGSYFIGHTVEVVAPGCGIPAGFGAYCVLSAVTCCVNAVVDSVLKNRNIVSSNKTEPEQSSTNLFSETERNERIITSEPVSLKSESKDKQQDLPPSYCSLFYA